MSVMVSRNTLVGAYGWLGRVFRTAVLVWVGAFACTGLARASDAAQIRGESAKALEHLYSSVPSSRALGQKAVAVLIFPKIYKAGFIVGGEHGEGTLFKGKEAAGYYDIAAVSVGLQAGAQAFGYALFFMNQKALNYLDQSDGWALGSGPSLVVWDQSQAASLSTTTLSQDVYAVPFGGEGLMAGLGLEGSKITRIKP